MMLERCVQLTLLGVPPLSTWSRLISDLGKFLEKNPDTPADHQDEIESLRHVWVPGPFSYATA